jgi:hypothetical protein
MDARHDLNMDMLSRHIPRGNSYMAVGGFWWAEYFKIGRMPSTRQQLRLERLEEEPPYLHPSTVVPTASDREATGPTTTKTFAI